MKHLFTLLLLFSCGTLFAQKKNTKPSHSSDTLFRGVSWLSSYATEFDGNQVLNVLPYVPIGSSGSFYKVYNPWKDNFPDFTWSKDTLNIINLSTIKFIKMPTGEVYKIVRETKLEKAPELVDWQHNGIQWYHLADTVRLSSPNNIYLPR